MNGHKGGNRLEEILNKVAGYRVMLNFSQKDMAKYLNITPQSYSNKERGFRRFNDCEKIKIKELFNRIDSDLTIDEIFF